MQDHLPPGIKFNPRTGFIIEEPLVTEHNGTYLCVFIDSGSGHKVNKLEIHLLVREKEEETNQLEVWGRKYIFIVIQPLNILSNFLFQGIYVKNINSLSTTHVKSEIILRLNLLFLIFHSFSLYIVVY